MPNLYVHVARGSANRKLTGRNGKKDSRVWVINPVGFGDTVPEPGPGRAYLTCPNSCTHKPSKYGGPLDGEGDCYAADNHMMWTADKHGDTLAADAVREVRDAIAAGKCEAVRYGVIGDYGMTSVERAISAAFLTALRITCDSAGIPLITYTHTWCEHTDASFDPAVNASCDSIEQVYEARDRGFQPVYVARDEDHAREVAREHGGFVCPEMTGRVDGCFSGRTRLTEGKRKCGGATPLCAMDRRGALMVLINH